MPNISRGNVAVQWFATRHERVKPKAAPKPRPQVAPVRLWTQDDDDYLRKHYQLDGSAAVSLALGRTRWAVQARASVIGVTAPKFSLRISA